MEIQDTCHLNSISMAYSPNNCDKFIVVLTFHFFCAFFFFSLYGFCKILVKVLIEANKPKQRKKKKEKRKIENQESPINSRKSHFISRCNIQFPYVQMCWSFNAFCNQIIFTANRLFVCSFVCICRSRAISSS